MAKTMLPPALVLSLLLLLPLSDAQSGCGSPCTVLADCIEGIICIAGQCTDDPGAGTNFCAPAPDQCPPSGTVTCSVRTFPLYSCSPPVTFATSAILTNDNFREGGGDSMPAKCDGLTRDSTELVVGLSTGWYNGGSRCGQTITITASSGLSVEAEVVDECDSLHGCDLQSAGLPPCRNNVIDGSTAVWNALGLDVGAGEQQVTWTLGA